MYKCIRPCFYPKKNKSHFLIRRSWNWSLIRSSQSDLWSLIFDHDLIFFPWDHPSFAKKQGLIKLDKKNYISYFSFSGIPLPFMGYSFMHYGAKSSFWIQRKPIYFYGHLQRIPFVHFSECFRVSIFFSIL